MNFLDIVTPCTSCTIKQRLAPAVHPKRMPAERRVKTVVGNGRRELTIPHWIFVSASNENVTTKTTICRLRQKTAVWLSHQWTKRQNVLHHVKFQCKTNVNRGL